MYADETSVADEIKAHKFVPLRKAAAKADEQDEEKDFAEAGRKLRPKDEDDDVSDTNADGTRYVPMWRSRQRIIEPLSTLPTNPSDTFLVVASFTWT